MGELFGPYELLRSLATGGMGQIYLARSTRAEGFSKLLVVKLLLAEHAREPGFIAMFLDEARIAARLNHPNIGQIFDLGDVGGTYYLAMEYVPGVDLRTLERDCADKTRPIPLPLACRIFADAAAGLHYAHELTDDAGQALGVVHRDVSPSNILVSFDGGVKIIDFGIAKAKGRSTSTAIGQLKGKFAYMSPEQAEGDSLDRRSDLYSLGLVFHEVITGKRVLQRDSDTQTLKAAREGLIEPPSKVNPLVPPSLDGVIGRALARRPEDRFATARDFGLAIEDWLLQCREPASSAHLAEFVKGLYPDHAERARGPSLGTDDGLGGTVVRTPSGAPNLMTRTALTPTGARVETPPAPPVPPTPPLPTASIPKRPLSRRKMLGIVVLALFSLMFVRKLRIFSGLFQVVPERRVEAAPDTPDRFRLKVTSTPPGAIVRFDGEELGKTPFTRSIEADESGELTVDAPGFITHRERLEMTSDRHIAAKLERATVRVILESQPPGAKVRAGDEELQVTPFEWKAPEQLHVLTFELPGYEKKVIEIEPRDGLVVKASLKKAEKPSSSPFTTKGSR